VPAIDVNSANCYRAWGSPMLDRQLIWDTP
jgi:hypothetical protein